MVWRLPISMGMIYVSLFCLPRLPGTYYMLWHIEVSTTDYYTKWSKRKTNIWYHLNVESKKMIQMNLFTKQKWAHRHWKQREVGEG